MSLFASLVRKVKGMVAHDAADTAENNPISIGGRARTSLPAAVSDADAVRAYFDERGRLAIQDGGATLSVDDGAGSLTVDTAQLPGSLGQASMAGSTSVVIASNQSAVPVSDGGGSLTVDGTVNVAAIESNVTVEGEMTVTGKIQQDSPDNNSTNFPVKIGGGGSSSAPSAVSADGDIVNAWFDLNGRQAVFDGGLSLSVDDGAGSLTVDGTVAVSNMVSNANLENYTTDPQGDAWYASDGVEVDARATIFPILRLSTTSIAMPSLVSILNNTSMIHSDWTTAPKWFFADVTNMKRVAFSLANGFNQNVTLEVYGTFYVEDEPDTGSTYNQNNVLLKSVTVNAAASAFFGGDAGVTGTSADYYQAPLNIGWNFIILKITPAADPTSGQLGLLMTRTL